jgi:hypothetical protein
MGGRVSFNPVENVMDQVYESRLNEFGETYTDCEAEDVGQLVIHAGERLAALVLDEAAVDAAMKGLHRALDLPDFASDHTGDRSWQTLWGRTSVVDLETLPLAQKLTSLNAYAHYGLSPTSDGRKCTIDDIKLIVGIVTAAIGRPDADRPQTKEIDKTILAAQGRLALDEEGGITLDQLAALARISIKSMRNAAAPSSGSGLEVKEGLVSAVSALKWLNARGNFNTSIWKETSESSSSTEATQAAKGEILWVPFASDKTEFHPSTCLRAGKYTVGPKGSEQTVTDYRQALDRLARMRPSPLWRRPNTVGNWGIVTAVGFHPRTAEELGLLPGSGDKK